MPRYRIVFMGSPDFAIPSLRILSKNHDICAVYTQPDKLAGRGMRSRPVPLADYAIKAGLPKFSPQSLLHKDVHKQLIEHEADLFVVVAYGMLLPKAVLDIPKHICINAHASLLPRWRGAAPIQHAILAGDKQTGVSIMHMNEGLDTGNILMQTVCDIDNNETFATLHNKLSILTSETLYDAVENIISLMPLARPQDSSNATYAKKVCSQVAEIDWSRNCSELDQHIRAFTPSPGAWCHGPKGRLRIIEAKALHINKPPSSKAGSVVNVDKALLHIATGDGVLDVKSLQPAGKRIMGIKDFLNGQKLNIGQPLAKSKISQET